LTVGDCKPARHLEAGDRVRTLRADRVVEEVDIHANGTTTVLYATKAYSYEDAKTFRSSELVEVVDSE
jgi:hypothetical protein